jgi:hypothetical protein
MKSIFPNISVNEILWNDGTPLSVTRVMMACQRFIFKIRNLDNFHDTGRREREKEKEKDRGRMTCL